MMQYTRGLRGGSKDSPVALDRIRFIASYDLLLLYHSSMKYTGSAGPAGLFVQAKGECNWRIMEQDII